MKKVEELMEKVKEFEVVHDKVKEEAASLKITYDIVVKQLVEAKDAVKMSSDA